MDKPAFVSYIPIISCADKVTTNSNQNETAYCNCSQPNKCFCTKGRKEEGGYKSNTVEQLYGDTKVSSMAVFNVIIMVIIVGILLLVTGIFLFKLYKNIIQSINNFIQVMRNKNSANNFSSRRTLLIDNSQGQSPSLMNENSNSPKNSEILNEPFKSSDIANGTLPPEYVFNKDIEDELVKNALNLIKKNELNKIIIPEDSIFELNNFARIYGNHYFDKNCTSNDIGWEYFRALKLCDIDHFLWLLLYLIYGTDKSKEIKENFPVNIDSQKVFRRLWEIINKGVPYDTNKHKFIDWVTNSIKNYNNACEHQPWYTKLKTTDVIPNEVGSSASKLYNE